MTHRRLTVAGLPALVIAVALTVAGCGSNSNSSAGDGGDPGGGGGSTPAGAPIKVGLLGTLSGSQQANAASKGVATAWEKWTNDHGGLNGHAVKVVIADDGGSPTTGLKQARQLVESDHVAAIVDASLVDSAWQKYVEQKQVPVVGGVTFEAPMFTSADFFPSGANILAETYGFLSAGKQEGVTKIAAFYCAEAPECAQVAPLIKGIGGQVIGGVSLVDSASISATAPSYVAQCLQAKKSGAQALAVYASPDIVNRIQQQCSQQGFNPKYVGINGVLPYSAAASGNYEGAIVALGNLPLGNTDTPGGKDLADALAKYAPSVTKDPTWNANPASVWPGLQLFAQAVTTGKLGPDYTSADIIKALTSLKDETLGGLSGPLNYTAGKPTFIACPFIAQIKDGAWTTLNGNKPECVPAQAMAALGQIAAAAAG